MQNTNAENWASTLKEEELQKYISELKEANISDIKYPKFIEHTLRKRIKESDIHTLFDLFQPKVYEQFTNSLRWQTERWIEEWRNDSDQKGRRKTIFSNDYYSVEFCPIFFNTIRFHIVNRAKDTNCGKAYFKIYRMNDPEDVIEESTPNLCDKANLVSIKLKGDDIRSCSIFIKGIRNIKITFNISFTKYPYPYQYITINKVRVTDGFEKPLSQHEQEIMSLTCSLNNIANMKPEVNERLVFRTGGRYKFELVKLFVSIRTGYFSNVSDQRTIVFKNVYPMRPYSTDFSDSIKSICGGDVDRILFQTIDHRGVYEDGQIVFYEKVDNSNYYRDMLSHIRSGDNIQTYPIQEHNYEELPEDELLDDEMPILDEEEDLIDLSDDEDYEEILDPEDDDLLCDETELIDEDDVMIPDNNADNNTNNSADTLSKSKYYKILVSQTKHDGSVVKKWVAEGGMGIYLAPHPRFERNAVIISENCINTSKTLKENLEGKDYELVPVENPEETVGIYLDDIDFLEMCP